MHTKGMFGKTYNEVEPVNYSWISSHIKTIEYAYRKSKYFDNYFPAIKAIYDVYSLLSTPRNFDEERLMLPSIAKQMFPVIEEAFDIHPRVVLSSQLHLSGEKSSDLILAICQELKATEYYAGRMSLDYLKYKEFEEVGIKIIQQTYQSPNNYAFIHQLFTNGATL
jgi:hypothetical protein